MNIIRLKRGFLRRIGGFLPDSYYVMKLYEYTMGYKFDLQHPQSFNEKLQWLKVYDRRPEYTIMVDKAAVKDYVAKIIGPEYIIPTIGLWNNATDIPWYDLPNSFVLKVTCGGGGTGVVVCRDKHQLNQNDVISKLNRAQKKNIYRNLREWPYKNVPNRILAEEFLSDTKNNLCDYKFFCFNGRCEFFKVDFDRYINHHANYYDREAHILPFGEALYPPVFDYPVVIPTHLSEMIMIAEKLAKGIAFLRVDLYESNDKIYFGETTFYPASGMARFTRPETDIELGKKLVLPSL